MVQRTRLWLGVGLFTTALGLPALAQSAGHSSSKQGGEGGEGGEAGHSAAHADLAQDDAAFLAALGMIEGHLWIATELYAAGERELARPHVKHPEDEIYGSLRPALNARAIPGFSAQLSAMALTAESGGTPEAARAAFDAVRAELLRVRTALAPSPSAILGAVARMTEAAGKEYGEGVQGGRVVNAKEYHDAYGFVRVGKSWVSGLDPAVRSRSEAAVRRVDEALASLNGAWPSLTAREVPANFDEGRFDAVASLVELQAGNVR